MIDFRKNKARITREGNHTFVTLAQKKDNDNRGKLEGLFYGVKDNICVAGLPMTAGSKTLANFKPEQDARLIQLLREQGAVMMGKNTMDEFALGSTGLQGFGAPARNPVDANLIPGGSSSGGAAAVGFGEVDFAIGTDTGGSVRQPAAFCQVVGVKPCRGRISLDGVIAAGHTLDTVGILAPNVALSARVLSALTGGKIAEKAKGDISGRKIGVPKEYLAYERLEPGVRENLASCLAALEKAGAKVLEVSLPHFRFGPVTYDVIGTSEVAINLSQEKGVRVFHGKSFECIRVDRKKFGPAAKERIVAGRYFLTCARETLRRAQVMQRKIYADFRGAFTQVDYLITPTMPCPAYPIDAPERDDLGIFTIGINLAGYPAASLPWQGGAVQLVAGTDNGLLKFASGVEGLS